MLGLEGFLCVKGLALILDIHLTIGTYSVTSSKYLEPITLAYKVRSVEREFFVLTLLLRSWMCTSSLAPYLATPSIRSLTRNRNRCSVIALLLPQRQKGDMLTHLSHNTSAYHRFG